MCTHSKPKVQVQSCIWSERTVLTHVPSHQIVGALRLVTGERVSSITLYHTLALHRRSHRSEEFVCIKICQQTAECFTSCFFHRTFIILRICYKIFKWNRRHTAHARHSMPPNANAFIHTTSSLRSERVRAFSINDERISYFRRAFVRDLRRTFPEGEESEREREQMDFPFARCRTENDRFECNFCILHSKSLGRLRILLQWNNSTRLHSHFLFAYFSHVLFSRYQQISIRSTTQRRATSCPQPYA